jgi:hypothetical protein
MTGRRGNPKWKHHRYRRGHKDGLRGREAKATDRLYLEGWEKGQKDRSK